MRRLEHPGSSHGPELRLWRLYAVPPAPPPPPRSLDWTLDGDEIDEVPWAYRGAMSIAQRERSAMVGIMRAVGPDAPTLCEGWTTRDLAAHLMIREYRPDAAPGIVIPYFASRTAKVQHEVAERTDWDELLDKVASGPPIYSPLKLLDPVANVAEMFIHHEDVRRAQPGWEPRVLEQGLVGALRRTLPLT